MSDLSPVARTLGWAFLAWFVCFPLGAVVLLVGIATGASDASLRDGVGTVLGWLTWPVPVLFVVGGFVLVADQHRRDQAPGAERFVGVLMVLGAAFALSRGHVWPVVAAAVALALLVLTGRGRSTDASAGGGAA